MQPQNCSKAAFRSSMQYEGGASQILVMVAKTPTPDNLFRVGTGDPKGRYVIVHMPSCKQMLCVLWPSSFIQLLMVYTMRKLLCPFYAHLAVARLLQACSQIRQLTQPLVVLGRSTVGDERSCLTLLKLLSAYDQINGRFWRCKFHRFYHLCTTYKRRVATFVGNGVFQ